ncbi:glutamate receptor 1.4-like [Impatiens glandulifera]|uniref:glutamate receptor 1.4-like n=1 Tax=Impatiens glandulifera TaxID=253017 RepID=UPI001FB16CFC|nr:glutamate receptor 1.4-like [Impatiens glandulifera]
MIKKFPGHLFCTFLLLLSFVPRLYTQPDAANNTRRKYVSVGVTLDMGSWLANVVLTFINMSVSDFYAVNGNKYETRILLHLRDSKGDHLNALSAAHDLLENCKVEAIVSIPESLSQAEFLANLCDRYKVPLMSIATTPSSSFLNPHYIQIATERKTMAEGIAAIMTFFEWKKVAFISEDSNSGREMLSVLLSTFQETNIQIAYTLSISSSATDDVINQELNKLMDVGTKVYVVHISASLASRLFLNAKRLRMMRKEYAWVLTDEVLNLIDTLDSSVYETLQGAIGLRSHIPSSSKLQNFTRRWKKELWSKYPDVELVKTNIFGLRAYDTIWALAEAVERDGVRVANDEPHVQSDSSPGGFCIEVFVAAMKRLEDEIAYDFFPYVNSSGAMAGTYNDLIDSIYRGEYDAAVGDITITANRSLYVDFTSTFTDIGIGRMEHQIHTTNMWIFLKPLHSSLWLTTACFFIITGLVVWVIERPINEEFQGSLSQQIATALWFSLSTLVYAHRERLISNLSKFVIVVWIFVVLILTISYSATLTSMLTIQQIELVSKGKNYAIGYQARSPVTGIIFNNLNVTDTKVYSEINEYAEALLNGTFAAIIDEIPYIKFFLAKYPSGNYVMVSSKPRTSGFGFVFPKGSPLVSQLSSAIAQLREEGKLSRIEHNWLNPHSSFAILKREDNSTTSTPASLKLQSFKGLFLITGISSTSSFVIFLVKSLCQEWRDKFREIKMRILRIFGEWFVLLKDRSILNV